MKFLSALDAKDRRLMLWCLAIAAVLVVALGFLSTNGGGNDNRLPSTYLASQHGARAAYETLLRANYPIERWDRPLPELAAIAGPDTVVIFAEPFTRERENIIAVRQIVERGGRVISTGYFGGFILPGGQPDTPKEFTFAACKLEPEGIDSLANSGEVWMVPEASWQVGNPAHRIQYSCAGQPAIVEYNYGKGHVVWWASATPLENASLARANDLDLLLNSIGTREGHHFYWDESLHGDVRSNWSYVSGPARNMLWIGLPVLGLLIVLSFSRRRGPVRDLPEAPRAAPVEFLDALGSLYRSAGASATALSVALERFRRHALRLCGLRPSPMGASELAAAIRKRFPHADTNLEADLTACEDATWSDVLEPRTALRLIQTLHAHQRKLDEAARPGRAANPVKEKTTLQERAS
ncbi:MAG TPA: DUF4350 domain-containing protein [Terracidiphilus sp.]|jgi:hypothetical protein|nr:DUF4350 domain-containing protein [Terracidiphilus sp.]